MFQSCQSIWSYFSSSLQFFKTKNDFNHVFREKLWRQRDHVARNLHVLQRKNHQIRSGKAVQEERRHPGASEHSGGVRRRPQVRLRV